MNKSACLLALLLLVFACKTGQKTAKSVGDDGKIEVIFLQLNDVYEISPLENGTVGGMARVATLRKRLLAENPNTFTMLAGDFISPSVIGTLKFEGSRIRGRHMVETMNALGVDFVAFGNHEFDYDLADLQARLNESKFTWIGTNIINSAIPDLPRRFSKSVADGKPVDCPKSVRFSAKDADGTTVQMGLVSSVLPSNPKPYVVYLDIFDAAKSEAEALKIDCDAVFGLTHLSREDDARLAEKIPFLPLIMGGHEHDNMRFEVGKTVVAKADANAKTAYVHRLFFDKKAKTCTLKSQLIKIDASIQPDAEVAQIVKKWEDIAENSFKKDGFDASKIVAVLKEPLDCRDGTCRIQQMPVGKILTDAMLKTSRQNPDCAVFNSGSLRLDDFLRGSISQRDVLRLMPFGGGFSEVEMGGKMLRRMLTAGNLNRGKGGFLQWGKIGYQGDSMTFLIGGKPLDDKKTYRVAIGDFLLTGNEQGLEFLKIEGNADIKDISKRDPADKTDLRNDVRLALIEFWKI